MKRRKMMSCMMAAMTATMMIAAPMTARAADPPGEEVKVRYTQESTFTMSIPESIDLDSSKETTKNVGFSSYNIAPGKQVKLTVEQKESNDALTDITNGVITLTEANDNSFKAQTIVKQGNYSVNSGTPLLTIAECMSSDPFTVVLSFSKPSALTEGDALSAGSYSGTLVFTAEVVPIE